MKHFVAISLFAAAAVALPAISYHANKPVRTLRLAEIETPAQTAPVADAGSDAAPVVEVPEVVISAKPEPKARRVASKAEWSCWRETMRLTGDTVKVCGRKTWTPNTRDAGQLVASW